MFGESFRFLYGTPEMCKLLQCFTYPCQQVHMSRNWEATFSSWGASPSATEQAKAENAERAVRKAIAASAKLNAKPIETFTHGSYATAPMYATTVT